MRTVVASICALLSVILLANAVNYQAAEGGDPKYTIKDVMRIAHKEGLLKKVYSGEGDKKDAEKLVELYVALSKNTPPAGEKDAWAKRTKAMVAAAKAAVKGDEKERAALKKAVNCAKCHGEHKG
jgi:cytochrome c553